MYVITDFDSAYLFWGSKTIGFRVSKFWCEGQKRVYGGAKDGGGLLNF